jgi:hypothetical protein
MSVLRGRLVECTMVAEPPSLVLGGSRRHHINPRRRRSELPCVPARTSQRISLLHLGRQSQHGPEVAAGGVNRDDGRDGKAFCELQGDPSQRSFWARMGPVSDVGLTGDEDSCARLRFGSRRAKGTCLLLRNGAGKSLSAPFCRVGHPLSS